MTGRQRSPFGELVLKHRRQRGWSQETLATLASRDNDTDRHVASRTVAALEKRVADPSKWISPHPSTVSALANAFALAPNTSAHRDFLEAAATTRTKQLPSAAPPDEQEHAHAGRAATFDRLHLDTVARTSTTAFVAAGRQDHLDHIASTLRDIVAGHPRMVFVSAEAGTGKTWLVSEAARRAVQQHPGLVVLWGNSTGRLGAADPFQPFRQILRAMVGDIDIASPQQLVSGENGQRLLDRLPVAIDALHTEGQGLMHRLLVPIALDNPRLRTVLDPKVADQIASLKTGTPSTIADEPDVLLSRVAQHYAAAGPTMIVLEDLHWTDASTATVLLRFLADLQASNAPILVLGTYRPGDLLIHDPDEEHPLPPLLQQVSDVFPDHVIDLSTSLDAAGGRAFVSEVSARNGHAIDARELDAIYAHTRGLPIIVNGLLRLHDGDVNAFANAATLAIEGDTPISPPSEIRAMFESQMERLDDDVRNLLAYASVQGVGFSAEILMTAAGISPGDFDAMVNDVLIGQHHLIDPGGISAMGGRRIQEYQFSHALLRDHIYLDRMTDFERSHLHLATAEAAQHLFGETDRDASSIVAFHFDRAGETSLAASAYVVAGNQALNLSQFDRAWHAYNRVLELDVHRTNPLAEASALLGLGNCARSLDHPVDATTWLNRSIDLSRRRGFTAIQASALSTLGMLDYDSGHVHRGVERLRQAIELHLLAGDIEEAARSMARISYNLHGMGHYDEAALHARRGIELATQAGNDALVVGARIGLANCLLDIGLFDQAIDHYEDGIVISTGIADSHRVNICLINISLCRIELGQWQAAQDAMSRMMAPGRTVIPRYVGVAWFQNGLAAEGLGEYEYAHTCYEQSANIRANNGQEALLIDAKAGMLRIATHGGDLDAIREFTVDIGARAAEHGLDGIEHVGRLAVTMVEAARALGDDALASSWLTWGHEYIMARANRLADPDHRRSYLSNVVTHRRLVEMAVAAGLPPPAS